MRFADEAPSAVRSANSLRRTVLRASSKLAMVVQHSRRTSITAPSITRRMVRESPARCC